MEGRGLAERQSLPRAPETRKGPLGRPRLTFLPLSQWQTGPVRLSVALLLLHPLVHTLTDKASMLSTVSLDENAPGRTLMQMRYSLSANTSILECTLTLTYLGVLLVSNLTLLKREWMCEQPSHRERR